MPSGVGRCVERMIALTDQLRRLKVDYYEYIALKVIILLSSSGGECPGALPGAGRSRGHQTAVKWSADGLSAPISALLPGRSPPGYRATKGGGGSAVTGNRLASRVNYQLNVGEMTLMVDME